MSCRGMHLGAMHSVIGLWWMVGVGKGSRRGLCQRSRYRREGQERIQLQRRTCTLSKLSFLPVWHATG